MEFHRVYTCYHAESCTFGTMFEDSEYSFVERPCQSCTDAPGTPSEYEIPGQVELDKLASLTRELEQLTFVVTSNLKLFDKQELMLTQDIQVAIPPKLVDLLFGKDRKASIDHLFHLSAVDRMLKNATQFAKDKQQRPFFDFCLQRTRHYLNDSKANLQAMYKAARKVKHLQETDRPQPVLRWPNSRFDYEPKFGVEELELLRDAGEPGLELLRQPLTPDAMHAAGLLIERMKQSRASRYSVL